MYLYQLEKSSKKYICPKCKKKRFVRYINMETKEYLHSEVGRCDREINCGYHYKPRDYFKDKNIQNKCNFTHRTITQKPVNKENTKPSSIKQEIMNASLKNYRNNNFIFYLKTLFTEVIVQELSKRFFIGTSKYWSGATVFWQIDEKYQIRSGKIILYNKYTGKRSGKINWVHKVLKYQNFNLKQCLFGLHQLPENQNKIIGIVESEKTAIIMTGLTLSEKILSNYIWLATGSLSMLKPELFRALKYKKIVLFPDLGIVKTGKGSPFDRWKAKLPELQEITPYINISDLLEKKANKEQKEKGLDIADFVIDELKKKYISLNYLKNTYPKLQKLIHKLDLQQINSNFNTNS